MLFNLEKYTEEHARISRIIWKQNEEFKKHIEQ